MAGTLDQDQDTFPIMQTRFYVEGIHCASCIDRLERLPERVPFVRAARVHFGKSILSLESTAEVDLSRILREIARMGYQPRLLPTNGAQRAEAEARTQENRLDLIRLGVAAFGAGNVMMLAAGVYTGATGIYARTFETLSWLLSLPVIFFSGAPFLRSFQELWHSRRISIDLPIAFAILSGFLASSISLIRGHGPLYLDSGTALVFLLLGSRLFLKKLQRDAQSKIELHSTVLPPWARLLDDNERERLVPSQELAHGSLLRVYPGELIAGDAEVISGESFVSTAVLTGEPKPSAVAPGSLVSAGARNESAPLTLRLTKDASESRLSLLLEKARRAQEGRPSWSRRSDRVARIYVLTMLVASAFLFLFFDLERALALLVVTCPCALALATPLSAARAMAKGASQGIFFRSAEALEKVLSIREVSLDKTGTLTLGSFEWEGPLPSPEFASILLALESRSLHPIARSIVRALAPLNPPLPEVLDFQELRGKGVQGVIQGHFWEIGTSPTSTPPPNEDSRTLLELRRDGAAQMTIQLRDQIREEAKTTVTFLKQRGLKISILSGDRVGTVQACAKELGLNPDLAFGHLNPEEKAARVQTNGRSLMVGDGINDSLALESAFVGVSLRAGILDACPTADVVITEGGIGRLLDVFQLADRTFRSYRVQLATTIVYNVLAGSAAAGGLISPLVAALIMPVSSVTAIALSRRLT